MVTNSMLFFQSVESLFLISCIICEVFLLSHKVKIFLKKRKNNQFLTNLLNISRYTDANKNCAFPDRFNRGQAGEEPHMTKSLKKIWDVISTMVILATVVLAILLAGVRLVGLRPFAVLSGSMEPVYPVGSLIYVRNCDPDVVQVGDAITFVLDKNLNVATHRVVAIDEANQHFYTKGDANASQDGAPVYFKNLIGRPVFTIPYLGYFAEWISNPPGMYLAITAAAVFAILLFLPDALHRAEEADRKKARAEKGGEPG